MTYNVGDDDSDDVDGGSGDDYDDIDGSNNDDDCDDD